jgi:23S rRNA (adenine2030-N6)-methyltransferase
MLSYRHAFHAGNHADVLKHIVLQSTLRYLTQKDKPFLYIDTHAGAGGYRLDSDYAEKTGEFHEGIEKLWQCDDMPEAVAEYIDLIRQFNYASGGKKLNYYPGSPWIAQTLLRPEDKLVVSELHSTDFPLLNKHFRNDKRIRIFEQDGYKTLNAMIPPPQKRSLVLMDPSYEQKKEYHWVTENLMNAHKKFTTGVYLLWYPVVNRESIDRIEKTLKRSGITKIQLFEFAMQEDTNESGMTASGMIVINPPWKLMETMQKTLPYLVSTLSPEKGSFRAEVLVGENPTQETKP